MKVMVIYVWQHMMVLLYDCIMCMVVVVYNE